MKFGVIVFPGSNCDHDAYHVFSKHVGQPVDFIWHRETDLSSYDAVILPGGFSYGDYLRAGALARRFTQTVLACGELPREYKCAVACVASDMLHQQPSLQAHDFL